MPVTATGAVETGRGCCFSFAEVMFDLHLLVAHSNNTACRKKGSRIIWSTTPPCLNQTGRGCCFSFAEVMFDFYLLAAHSNNAACRKNGSRTI